MKQFWKHALRVVVFVAGLIVILLAVSVVMTPKDNTERAGILSERAYGFLAEPENSLDVLFLGDSEGYRAFVPLQMWEEYGFTSFVCNTSSQQLYLTERILNQALEKQSPKYVILETLILYRYTPYSDVLMNHVSNVLPVFRYHDHWKQLSLRDFVPKVEYTHIDPFKGYAFLSKIEPAAEVEHMKPTKEASKISNQAQKSVARIAEICHAHGAELLLISSPSTTNWNMYRHNAVQKLADRLGIQYMDMNLMTDDIPIDWSVDTYDAGDHLNYTGAVKVSAYLGAYLHDEGLPDHREDASYAAWNDSLAAFKRFIEDSYSKK